MFLKIFRSHGLIICGCHCYVNFRHRTNCCVNSRCYMSYCCVSCYHYCKSCYANCLNNCCANYLMMNCLNNCSNGYFLMMNSGLLKMTKNCVCC